MNSSPSLRSIQSSAARRMPRMIRNFFAKLSEVMK